MILNLLVWSTAITHRWWSCSAMQCTFISTQGGNRKHVCFESFSQNIAILINFKKFKEKDLCRSFFLKHPPTLLESRLWHKCFPLNSEKKNFRRRPGYNCFCFLKRYSGRTQNWWIYQLLNKLTSGMLVK